MTPSDPADRPRPWYRRLHAALMPDYNAAATTYWWSAVIVGGCVLLACLWQLLFAPASHLLQIAVAAAFAVAGGLFPVRIPGTRVSFGVGELTIFLVLLLLGPAAATVLAAAEAALGSFRSSKRWTSRLGSPAMATLAMFTAAQLFETARAALAGAAGHSALAGGAELQPVPLLGLSLALGLVYFFFSATLMGGVARLKRGEHLLQPGDLLGPFRWVGLAFAGSALFATLLYLVYRQAGVGVFAVTVPLVAMLLLVLHFYYRHQEAQQAMRAALAEIAEREASMQQREAEAAARHAHDLQLSERRFLGAFTQAAIGMVLLDLQGRVIEANEALGRLLGRPPAAVVGAAFASLVQADESAAFAARLNRAREIDFEDFEQEVRLLAADGAVHRVRALCCFFSGPAAHGAGHAGKPCLMLQVQPLDPPGRLG